MSYKNISPPHLRRPVRGGELPRPGREHLPLDDRDDLEGVAGAGGEGGDAVEDRLARGGVHRGGHAAGEKEI